MASDAHPADRLHAALHGFMPYYMGFINPVLHRTKYQGRVYVEFEIIVVMALSVVGPQRPSELSRGFDVDKGSMTAVLRRLADLDLIERHEIPGDARGYRASLTPAGDRLVAHLSAQHRDGLRRLFDGMDPASIEASAHGLDLIAHHLRQRENAARPVSRPTEVDDENDHPK